MIMLYPEELAHAREHLAEAGIVVADHCTFADNPPATPRSCIYLGLTADGHGVLAVVQFDGDDMDCLSLVHYSRLHHK